MEKDTIKTMLKLSRFTPFYSNNFSCRPILYLVIAAIGASHPVAFQFIPMDTDCTLQKLLLQSMYNKNKATRLTCHPLLSRHASK